MRKPMCLPALLALAACAGPASNSGEQSAMPVAPHGLARMQGDTSPPSPRVSTLALFRGPQPSGVAVARDGRVFVTFPRWYDPVRFTVGEYRNGTLAPYPTAAANVLDQDHADRCFVSVQTARIDSAGRLWLLDTGKIDFADTLDRGPKLVGFDLEQNRPLRTYFFPKDVALDTTYLNDVRFDLRRGTQGVAFITDSSQRGPNAIIVLDLSTGRSVRRLHDHPAVKPVPDFAPVVDGQPLMMRPPIGKDTPLRMGADGIALSPDGETLYFRPLISRHLYSVSADALADFAATDANVAATVRDLGDLGYASDGLECDAEGRLYLTDYEHHAIHRRTPDGADEVLASDARFVWTDSLFLGDDGTLTLSVNQFERLPMFHDGKDLRKPPYALFQLRVDAHPSPTR